MEYVTASELRGMGIDMCKWIPDTDKFLRGVFAPHPDNKVADMQHWLRLQKKGDFVGWLKF